MGKRERVNGGEMGRLRMGKKGKVKVVGKGEG